MTFDNVIIHYYPAAPAIAKCAVHLRAGKKIVLRTVLKDLSAANVWLFTNDWQDKPHKLVVHWGA